MKRRPAVVLREMSPFRDVLVCGVSTQLQQYVAGFDEILRATDSDFATSGVQAESVIRLGFLTVLPCRVIPGSIGAISAERHERLLRRLAEYLTQSSQ